MSIDRIRELAMLLTEAHGRKWPVECDRGDFRELLDAAACLAVMREYRLTIDTASFGWSAWKRDDASVIGFGRFQVDAVRDWCQRNGHEWPAGDAT